MPAEINIRPEIALGIKQQDSMTSLGNLLNMANAAQQLQQTRQLNPLELEKRQMEIEQLKKINPLAVRQYEELVKQATTATEKSAFELAGQKAKAIHDTQISLINNPLVLKAEKNPELLKNEDKQKLYELIEKSGKNQAKALGMDEAKALELMQPTLEMAANNPGGLRQLFKERHIQTLDAASRTGALTASGVPIDTGAGGKVVQTGEFGPTPPGTDVAGTKFEKQLPPGSRIVPTGDMDLYNRPLAYVYDQSGTMVDIVPIPASALNQTPQPNVGNAPVVNPNAPAVTNQPAPQVNQKPVFLRPGETKETLTAAQQIRSNASNAALTYQNQQFNNNEIIKLADATATGKGAEILANLTGGYAIIPKSFTSNNADNLNKLGHYMALQTAELAKSSGVNNTNAGQALAGEISSTTQWTPEAIKSTARVNRALSTATNLFNQGIENAFKKTNDPFSAKDFQNKWSQIANVNAIRFADAKNNKDVEGMKEVLKSVNALDKKGNVDVNSDGYKNLLKQIRFMQNLVNKGE